MNEPAVSLISVVERLAKLEGLLQGLQNTLVQNQTQVASFMGKVSDLERRQVELERQMVTSADMQQLNEKVDRLIASEARLQGRSAQAQFALPVLAQYGAVAIALLALLSTTANRFAIEQQRQNPPQLTR